MTKEEEEHADNIYLRYRTYIEHEDHLVNFRVGWLVAIEAGAMAAFGLTLNASGGDIKQFLFYFSILIFFGLVSAILSIFSVGAAVIASRRLSNAWHKKVKGQLSQDYVSLLPHIAGAGWHSLSSVFGHASALALPLVFALGWLVILAHVIRVSGAN